jgi:hypothetical protein
MSAAKSSARYHGGKKGSSEYGRLAFERGLELLDLTVADARNRSRLRELARRREALADHFAFSNDYRSTDESWQKYFYNFAFAARAQMSGAQEKPLPVYLNKNLLW